LQPLINRLAQTVKARSSGREVQRSHH
jgi:hypothetical protein